MKKPARLSRWHKSKAVETLYGSWSALPQSSVEFIEQTLEKKNYIEAFEKFEAVKK